MFGKTRYEIREDLNKANRRLNAAKAELNEVKDKKEKAYKRLARQQKAIEYMLDRLGIRDNYSRINYTGWREEIVTPDVEKLLEDIETLKLAGEQTRAAERLNIKEA